MKVVADLCHVRTPLLCVAPATAQAAAVPAEAIYLASTELHQEVQKKPLSGAETGESLALTLEKYRRRMSSRCTPFGLFAGVSTATFGDHTRFKLLDRTAYRKYTRLSMDYVCGLARAVTSLPEVREQLLFFPNNTLYAVADQLRYTEYTDGQRIRTHQLVHIDDSAYVQAVLHGAAAGARLRDLALLLVDDDISLEEALDFLGEMVDSQVLISELEPAVTGPEYWTRLVAAVARLSASSASTALTQLHAQLQAIDQLLERMSQAPIGDDTTAYTTIIELIQQLPAPYELKHLFQVDLVKPTAQATISRAVAEEARTAVEVMARLTPLAENETLVKFRDAYLERYEQREVPLLEVLDLDLGLGYPINQGVKADPAPLLDGFPARTSSSALSYPLTPWYQYLLDRYTQLLQRGETTLALEPQQLAPFLKHELALPTSFSIGCTLLAESAQAIDAGQFQVQLAGISGPSAAKMMGRFCHGSPELAQQLRAVLHYEEQANSPAIYAEVAHLPQPRLGNISSRPVLRSYEIPIGTPSAVDADHTILLADLLVSVRDNRIVLRSQRLQREVIPCLSTAHNYSSNPLPVYHFLCDLQSQGLRTNAGFDWGWLSGAKFLPRVTYGRAILAKAQWRLAASEVPTPADLPAYLHERQVPAHVVLAEGDNLLPLDLRENQSLQMLWQALKRYRAVQLHENLIDEQSAWLPGPEGRFACELVIPFTSGRHLADSPTPAAQSLAQPSPATQFAPGSEWFYAKLYCGVKTADEVLVKAVLPFAEQMLQRGLISKWFFIRYADPQPHLRVRFLGNASVILAELEPVLRPFLDAGLLHRFQLDTYQRETERYGPHNIENSETLFFHDSAAVIPILAMLAGTDGETLRWQLALKGVDDLLTDLRFSLQEKQDLLAQLSRGFRAEFETGSYSPKELLRYKARTHRAAVEMMLHYPPAALAPALQYFAQRSQGLVACAEFIAESGLDKFNLAGSYVHMFLNRFLRSKQRMQELIIYDLLHEHYKSVMARARQSSFRSVAAEITP